MYLKINFCNDFFATKLSWKFYTETSPSNGKYVPTIESGFWSLMLKKRERRWFTKSGIFHQRGENPLDHHNYFKCQQIDISDWWHKKLTISQSKKGEKSHKM